MATSETLPAVLEEFMKANPFPSCEDNVIVLKLNRYIDNGVKNDEEQKDLNQALDYALHSISREFVCSEIKKMSSNVTASWLSQFQTIDLFEMMYEMRKKLVA